MPTLTPAQAAKIASGVYALRTQSVSQSQRRGASNLLGCEDMFTVDDSSRFMGKSGGLWLFKEFSGFGYIAAGKDSYQGHVLIATRGTKTGHDWVTNLNVGLQTGPGGFPVHAGFHETWKSFRHEVASFLQGRNPTVVHCVGHSLGGALAALNADHVSAMGVGSVQLYTFGCPRVGTAGFARALESRIGSNNMHRVYHLADPVPMIPVFPFVHTPTTSPGLAVATHTSLPISVGTHYMESYIGCVGNMSWDALSRQSAGTVSDNDVKMWLEGIETGASVVSPMGAATMKMLGYALRFLLKLTLNVLSGLITAGFTVIDQLALMLYRGAQIIGEVSMYVRSLIAAIMRFLGRATVTGASLTLQFIRWALEMLYRRVRGIALGALNALP